MPWRHAPTLPSPTCLSAPPDPNKPPFQSEEAKQNRLGGFFKLQVFSFQRYGRWSLDLPQKVFLLLVLRLGTVLWESPPWPYGQVFLRWDTSKQKTEGRVLIQPVIWPELTLASPWVCDGRWSRIFLPISEMRKLQHQVENGICPGFKCTRM